MKIATFCKFFGENEIQRVSEKNRYPPNTDVDLNRIQSKYTQQKRHTIISWQLQHYLYYLYYYICQKNKIFF